MVDEIVKIEIQFLSVKKNLISYVDRKLIITFNYMTTLEIFLHNYSERYYMACLNDYNRSVIEMFK